MYNVRNDPTGQKDEDDMLKITQRIVTQAEGVLSNGYGSFLGSLEYEGWITPSEGREACNMPWEQWKEIRLMLAVIMLEIYDEEQLVIPEENL